MYNVYFYEAFKEEVFHLKKYIPKRLKVGFSHYGLGEKKIPTNPPAKIISIRTQSIVPAIWSNKIEAVFSRSTGFDHLYKYSKLYKCGYLGSYCSQSVAETAIMFMFALMHKLPMQLSHFETFDRDNLTGADIFKKTVLIVGVGNIGSKIAAMAKNLGMKVLCVDIIKKFKKLNYTTINKALPKADVIISAMNLTEQNKNYFDFKFFKKAKQGAMFINIARGELSPIEDLLKALDKKNLSGAALDVYPNESTVAFDLRTKRKNISQMTKMVKALLKKPNVILTPHNAFNTIESTDSKAKLTMGNILYFLKYNRFKNNVIYRK